MKKILPVFLLAAILAISIPTGARSEISRGQDSQHLFLPVMVRMEKTGERLNIFESGSQSFPSNTPFHIVHGWQLDADVDLLGLFDFQVGVDGAFRKVDFIDVYFDTTQDPPALVKHNIYNFPEGMTGTHLFTGHWIAPCYVFYEDCSDPNELYESISEVDVTFVPES